MEQRVKTLEGKVEVLEKKSEQQAIEQAETKVYMKMVLQKLDSWETRLFGLFNNQTKAADKNSDRWLEAVKELGKITVYVVGAILAAKMFMK